MKKIFQILPFAIVLLALFLFQSVLVMFINNQNLLLMESNRLLTIHHVEVSNHQLSDDAIKEIINSYWKIKLMFESRETVVLAYYSSDYSKSTLPLSSGKMFEEENSNQVIVGKNIKTTEADGKEWTNYQGEKYEVVGKLGLIDNSPIDNYIIINNTELFQKADEEIVYLDSKYGKKLDELKEKYDLPINNISVERWFNISMYTRLVHLIGIILQFSISIIASIIFFNNRKDINELKYQMGISLSLSILKEVALLFFIEAIFFVAIYLHYSQYTSQMVLYEIICYSLISIIIIIFTYTVNVRRQMRRLNR